MLPQPLLGLAWGPSWWTGRAGRDPADHILWTIPRALGYSVGRLGKVEVVEAAPIPAQGVILRERRKVLVTGATGRTGRLVVEYLRRLPQVFDVVGLARSSARLQEVFGSGEGFVLGDIRDRSAIDTAIQGCQALVILTSASPQLQPTATPGERPSFVYEPGGSPEQVDWEGQRHQIDAAVAAGVEHVVLVGSMGGTQQDHPLNKMGGGNILIWKRRAEAYLIASGLAYTIIHPGGLLDQPGGRRELLVGQNDAFLHETPGGIPPSVPRADVAEVVVQALLHPEARNKAFDLISKPEDGAGAAATANFAALFRLCSALE